MSSKIKICNWALSRIAVSTTIDSLDEASQEAQTCALFFDQVRDHVTRVLAWPFATRYVQLAQVSGATTGEWQFAYRYPAGCLRFVRLVEPGATYPLLRQVPHAIAGDSAGRLVMTNQELAEAVFIARVEDVGQWPPDFSSLVAWRLASEIAAPLSQSGALADRCLREYYSALRDVAASGASEQFLGDAPDADYIRAR